MRRQGRQAAIKERAVDRSKRRKEADQLSDWDGAPDLSRIGMGSAAAVRPLRRRCIGASTNDGKMGSEGGLGAVEEGPAELEEEDSGAKISSNFVSCELTIEAIMDSYTDFYGVLSERRRELPIDAVPIALCNEHQTRTPLALMGRACW